jgi:predicted RNase H-like nuclease (RuvC/YqgF family)
MKKNILILLSTASMALGTGNIVRADDFGPGLAIGAIGGAIAGAAISKAASRREQRTVVVEKTPVREVVVEERHVTTPRPRVIRRSELAELKERIEDLQDALDEAQDTVAYLEEKLEECKRENRKLREEIRQLKQQQLKKRKVIIQQ